jgi:eukaryotic-like serine/threonine-protein kinase
LKPIQGLVVIGTTISHYQILEKTGEGGMGVVYRALDTRLNRPVALKVLAPAVMSDEQRRARFAGEAKAASALNHPNIITIYDVGETGGASFIAMEFVSGNTLDRLVGRRGLGVRDALNYGVQIADALAAAHAVGIVHRDLKPANVMVTGEGRVKVLDFGIAKLIERLDSGDAPTATQAVHVTPWTEEGTVIGTAAYMSPEQAEGKKVDARSDIFSFGSLLYEMVTGTQAFRGETKASTISAILEREPRPVREIAPDVPRELERIIRHCLRKDPTRRFQHLEDVKTLLLELKEEADTGKLFAPESTPATSGLRPRQAALVGSVAVLVSAGAIGAVWWSSRPSPAAPDQSPIRLTSDAGLTTQPALSADGTLLAFASDRGGRDNLDIWVKQVGGSETLRLTSDEADDYQPDLSSDGQRIAFRSERDSGGIFVVPTLGGDARLIAAGGRGPRFSPDGKWLAFWIGGIGADFSGSGGSKVYVVSSSGGTPRALASNLITTRHPVWSPDGSRLLVYGTTEYKGPLSNMNDWWVVPVDGGPAIKTGAFDLFRRQKLTGAFEAVPSAWTSENRIVFARTLGDSTNVWQVPISTETYRVVAAPQRLTAGTGLEGFPTVASVGPGGMLRLAFASINENIDVWSVPFAANGGANQGRTDGQIERLTQDAAPDVQPALSGDGSQMVFVSNRLGNQDIWTKDLKSGKETALTSTSLPEWHPVISADGSTVAYQVVENQKDFIHVLVRGRQPRRLCDDCFLPWDLSSDGTKMLYWSTDQRRVGLIDVISGAKTDLLSHPRHAFLHATFSPDDRWIAFHSIDHSGTPLNFLTPFPAQTPAAEREWIAVTTGSSYDNLARWSPDGHMIYFVSARDGFQCFWGQRLDRGTKRPVGAAFPVYHLHNARRSLGNVIVMFQEFEVSRDRLIFPLSEQSGNIWMIDR